SPTSSPSSSTSSTAAGSSRTAAPSWSRRWRIRATTGSARNTPTPPATRTSWRPPRRGRPRRSRPPAERRRAGEIRRREARDLGGVHPPYRTRPPTAYDKTLRHFREGRSAMATDLNLQVAGIKEEYKYGFRDSEENYAFKSGKGLTREIVCQISEM